MIVAEYAKELSILNRKLARDANNVLGRCVYIIQKDYIYPAISKGHYTCKIYKDSYIFNKFPQCVINQAFNKAKSLGFEIRDDNEFVIIVWGDLPESTKNINENSRPVA